MGRDIQTDNSDETNGEKWEGKERPAGGKRKRGCVKVNHSTRKT